MIYLLKTEPDDNDTVLVTCEAFPEVTTFADKGDKASIWKNGLGALEEAIAARIADGEDIPKGATLAQIEKHRGVWVKLPTMTTLKVELYKALKETDTTRAELMRKLHWNRESVDRLFRLDHNSRVDQIEEAFKAMNKNIDLRITEVA